MSDLKDKAIDIKGKKYILVSDRVLEFNKLYPQGCIRTELVSKTDDDMVVIKATVIPDINKPERFFTGYSQATWGDGYINKTSAMENCETSAVGRCLGFLGLGIIDSIASADEINKAQTQPEKKSKTLSVDDPNEQIRKLANEQIKEAVRTSKIKLSQMQEIMKNVTGDANKNTVHGLDVSQIDEIMKSMNKKIEENQVGFVDKPLKVPEQVLL
ncbi:MAG: hypothetical protein HGB12_00130 [Bacteroidetes bacterium]|nr:hypothetical protein [Bacteroidota bacterium]